MIETDEVGENKVKDLLESRDSFDWNDWELDFIENLAEKEYKKLTVKQKATITNLHDKLIS